MTTGMESGQSINITFYHKGFNCQVTVRDPELPVDPLIDKAIEAVEYGIKKGLKPSWNQQTNDEVLKTGSKEWMGNEEGLKCQICGEPAKQKSGTSKAGRPYNAIFCSSENRSHTQWL